MDTNQPHTNLVWHYTINGTGCHNKYRAAMPPPNSGEERERETSLNGPPMEWMGGMAKIDLCAMGDLWRIMYPDLDKRDKIAKI